MTSLPLHPLVVHLPIALAVLLPIVALALAIAIARGAIARRWFWVVPIGLLLTAATGYAAMSTGELDEGKVGRLIGKKLVHEHEERAELFVWSAVGLAVAAFAAAFLAARSFGVTLIVLSTVLTLALVPLAIWVGHSGGELVYRYGAARAHTGLLAPGPTPEKRPSGDHH